MRTSASRLAKALAAAIIALGSPPALAGATVVAEGLSIEFSLTAAGAGPSWVPTEGDPVQVRFTIRDATSGEPVRGLSPGAWMDIAASNPDREGDRACREKIGLYAKGLVGIRPMIDLNSYHLLVLNSDASISVIDPIVGMTGKTSLFTTILLRRPGADWVRSADSRRIYVAMPLAGQVAVVDAESFKVLRNVDAGKNPTRVALQPDGRYLWVGNDARDPADGGVTVIDTQSLERVGHVRTGRGHHEIAFSADERLAVVTNRADGTVSVVDVARPSKLRDLATGPVPISIATSRLSGAIYVADGREGHLSRIDPERGVLAGRIEAKPGLGPMRFSPDGRWGVVVNGAEHAVHVVDASTNALVHTVPVGGAPYQVAFTRAFAYVRLIDSARMALVHLDSLGEGKQPVVQTIGIGSGAPKQAAGLSVADSITPSATEQAVFAVNPADSTTYYYMEGMNAPSGSFGGYGHQARAVLVADRSMREVEPGVYGGNLRIPSAGTYQVALLLDEPRVAHCFTAEAKENPFIVRDRRAISARMEAPSATATAGSTVPLRVRMTDPRTGAPRAGLPDVQLVYFVSPGELKAQAPARDVGEGLYEAQVTLPRAGAYYVFVSVPSLDVKPGDLPFATLTVRGAAPAPRRDKEHARAD